MIDTEPKGAYTLADFSKALADEMRPDGGKSPEESKRRLVDILLHLNKEVKLPTRFKQILLERFDIQESDHSATAVETVLPEVAEVGLPSVAEAESPLVEGEVLILPDEVLKQLDLIDVAINAIEDEVAMEKMTSDETLRKITQNIVRQTVMPLFRKLVQVQKLLPKEIFDLVEIEKAKRMVIIEEKISGVTPVESSADVASIKKDEIDPTDFWSSFVRTKYPDVLTTPDSRGESRAEVLMVCDRIFSEYVSYEAHYLWKDPMDRHTAETEANFSAAPIYTKNQTLNYSKLFDTIPIPDIQKEFKEKLELCRKTYLAGSEWKAVIAEQPVPGSYEKFGSFFSSQLPTGSDWRVVQELPKLLDKDGKQSETSFGEQVFHSQRLYSTYNRRYVYANEGEKAEVARILQDEIVSGRVIIPKPTDVVAILTAEEKIERQRRLGKLLPKKLLGGSATPAINMGESDYLKSITQGDLLFVISQSGLPVITDGLDKTALLEKTYAQFVSNFKQLVSEEIVKKIESSNQQKYGIFPLAEFGLKNREKTLNSRREMAISIGTQTLGFGYYEPNIRSDYPNAGKLRAEEVASDGSIEVVYRELTDDEKDKAFEAGKAAELFGFNWYIKTCSHMFDDDVTAKAALTFQRVAISERYRSNYRNSRAELDGKYRRGISQVGGLLPRPLSYFGVEGISLQRILTRPDLYETADFSRIGDEAGGQIKAYKELWEWSVKMYKAMSIGASTVMGKNILQVGQIKTVKTVVAGVQDLEPDASAVRELATFATKVVTYWLNNVITTEGEMRSTDSSFFGVDESYWKQLKSPIDSSITTSIRTPLMTMFRLQPAEMHQLALQVSKAKNQKEEFTKEFMKRFIKICLIEDLMRSAKDTIDPEDYVTLCWVLTGSVSQWATLKYSIKDQGNPFTSDTGDIFKFTEVDVAHMCLEAGLALPPKVFEGLREAGGISGA